MWFPSWLRNGKTARNLPRAWTTRRESIARCRPTRLMVEILEDRCLLSTLTVTTSADNGAAPPAGSLRAELLAAQPLDTIHFAPTLTGGQTGEFGLCLLIRQVPHRRRFRVSNEDASEVSTQFRRVRG